MNTDGSVQAVGHEAYGDLEKDEHDLVEKLAQALTGLSTKTPSIEQIVECINIKLNERESHQLVLTVFKKPINIRAQWEKLIKFTIGCENLIGTAAALEPHAAIAWAGISLILPVSHCDSKTFQLEVNV